MPPRLALDLKLAFITAQPTPGQPPPADPNVPPGAPPAGPAPAPAPLPAPAAGPPPIDPNQPPAPPPQGPVDPVTGQPDVASMPVPAPANPPRPRTSADALQEAQLLGLAEVAQVRGPLAPAADPSFALRLAAVREQGRLVKAALEHAEPGPSQNDQAGRAHRQGDPGGHDLAPGRSGGDGFRRGLYAFGHSAQHKVASDQASSEIPAKVAAGPLGTALQAGRQLAPAVGRLGGSLAGVVRRHPTATAAATVAGVGTANTATQTANTNRLVNKGNELSGRLDRFETETIPATIADAKQQFRSTADDYLHNHAIPQVQQQVGQFAQQLPGQLINGAGTNLLALLTYLFGPGQAQGPKPNPQAVQHAQIIRGQAPVAPAV